MLGPCESHFLGGELELEVLPDAVYNLHIERAWDATEGEGQLRELLRLYRADGATRGGVGKSEALGGLLRA